MLFGHGSAILSELLIAGQMLTYLCFRPQLSAIPTLIPDGFIYLRANPDTCFNRLKKRGRSEETSVDMDYLQVGARTLTPVMDTVEKQS